MPRSRAGEKPIHHPKLGVYMQPLAFIEYSLENLKQAVLFSGETVTPTQMAAFLREESQRWGALIKAVGITAQ